MWRLLFASPLRQGTLEGRLTTDVAGAMVEERTYKQESHTIRRKVNLCRQTMRNTYLIKHRSTGGYTYDNIASNDKWFPIRKHL